VSRHGLIDGFASETASVEQPVARSGMLPTYQVDRLA